MPESSYMISHAVIFFKQCFTNEALKQDPPVQISDPMPVLIALEALEIRIKSGIYRRASALVSGDIIFAASLVLIYAQLSHNTNRFILFKILRSYTVRFKI